MNKVIIEDITSVDALYEQELTLEDFIVAMKLISPNTFVVEPGMITTMEFRSDNSRLYPQFNDEGKVIGGSFQ